MALAVALISLSETRVNTKFVLSCDWLTTGVYSTRRVVRHKCLLINITRAGGEEMGGVNTNIVSLWDTSGD